MDTIPQFDYPASFNTSQDDYHHYNDVSQSQNQSPLEDPHSVNINTGGPSNLTATANSNFNNTCKSRPCDACRRRKSRCVLKDGATKCVLCEFHDQSCTYVQTPQARKRKSVSIVQDEEVVVPSKRSPVRETRRYNHPHQIPGASPPTDRLIDDYAHLKGPSLLKRTLGLQRRRHGILLGSSGCFEPNLVPEFPGPLSRGDYQFLNAGAHDRFMLLADERTEHYSDELSDIDAIEAIVAPHGQALINLYFRIVHPSFPILHKKVYLEKYNRTHQEFSPPLLAAVYILALNYWSYSELAHVQKPKVEELEALAIRTLAYVVHRPKLSTVEAGLLLLQQRTGSSSWALTAQMVAVGQELGLHRDCSSWNIPSWEKGLRKRLAWALFMQDKWSALIHGRPPHISRDDWAVQPLTDKNFPENAADDDEREGSTDVEKGRSIFCHMVSLTAILSDVLQTLYSSTAESELRSEEGNKATKLVLSKAKPLQIRLKAWHAEVPTSLSMDNVTVRKLSSTGYVHLAYWAIEITLHRCIFRTLPECVDEELASICQNAAKARLAHAIAFVKGLKPEHLQSFWYFASGFNFALIGISQGLLCISAPAKVERDAEIDKYDEYRWILRVSSRNAGFLEQSLAMIDLFAGDLRALFRDMETNDETLHDVQNRKDSFQKPNSTMDRTGGLESTGAEREQSSQDNTVFDEEPDMSLAEDDTSLTWYTQTPSSEQPEQTSRTWENLELHTTSPYH